MEAAGLHGGDGFGVPHEGVPDEGAAQVFSHEDADTEVDAEDIGVIPVEFGVEGVAEAVASPCVLAEVFSQGAQDADAVVREEREGAGGGGGDYGAVDGAHEGRASPGGVAMLPVGGGDAPVVVGITAFEAEAEGFVRTRRSDGVGEIVGVGIALAGEVEPGVGELMDEEGIASADVGVRAEGHGRASEGAP